MDFRSYLNNLIRSKEEQKEDLKRQIKQAETADEVRALGETLDAVLKELTEAKEQLAKTEDEKKPAEPGDGAKEPAPEEDPQRSYHGVKTQVRGGEIIGAYSMGGQEKKSAGRYDTEEYRKAFMEFACRNVPMPEEYRADAVTTTGDAGAVIPTTILNEIISELKSYGNLYAKVRKLNIQGGVKIPILSLKPEAKWIGETAPSEDQKIAANDSISFSYFGLECKIAQTLLANVVTLSMFQELFVSLAVEAMAKALDVAIMNGNGTSQPLGILKDSRIPTENVIELTDAEIAKWDVWKKKVFRKMKKSYRDGEFIMAQSTFDGYIDGMVDSVGQPIGRVNYGIDGAETYRFAGKNIETVEDDILKPYDTAAAGDVIAVFIKLSNYAVNSNMEMQTVKWVDHDTNEIKNKCILIADGKLVDPNGVLIIKKKG